MAGMSVLKRLAPFAHVGGHLFRGRCARAVGAGGVRRAGGGAHIEPRYRQFPQLTRSQVIQAEFFSATMWFWILWRFWHDSDAVLGCTRRCCVFYGCQLVAVSGRETTEANSLTFQAG
uniref:NADH dehydrogenase [ubiquinone] 1 beta subcomplex subunit 2, mitochondrial n=1 Tax=Capra hircus TaxID=9925 RepID=A0A8C2RWU1_CAPHI